ncbi:hypothetical protein F0L68_05820 [Solihabitans fulvus]|uniref:Secreted protein n=1 Tax=Solihabitans fulvus TaxID=1892852 RepID=A0A5B2XMK7_9PSEU|nr:hypothetical protein F0L68_05820 [Solihabitans fulvus]
MNFFQYSWKFSAAWPVCAATTMLADLLPSSMVSLMPAAAAFQASANLRRAVSSPSGQLCPTTIGKSQVTSLGISIPTGLLPRSSKST